MMPKLPGLRAARVSKYLSQDDLAERAGISRPTISRAEAGEDARFVTIRKLADALAVDPRELTGELQSLREDDLVRVRAGVVSHCRAPRWSLPRSIPHATFTPARMGHDPQEEGRMGFIVAVRGAEREHPYLVQFEEPLPGWGYIADQRIAPYAACELERLAEAPDVEPNDLAKEDGR